MSGKGTEVGKSFSELKQIIDGVEYKDKMIDFYQKNKFLCYVMNRI